jgi:foldase protein PrsA
MRKILTVLLLGLCMVLTPMLSACALVEIDPQRDLDSVVAVVCGEQITKRMVMNEWNRQKAGMGVTDAYEQSEDGQRIISTVLQNLLQDMVKAVIRREQARTLGLYPLTDENFARVVARADELYDERLAQAEESLLDSYQPQDGQTQQSDLSQIAQESVALMMEEQFEFSREMDLRQAENEVIEDLLREYYGADITADEQQVQEYYDEILQQQKEQFGEDTNGVVSYLKNGTLIVYYPGNVVRVKHILIGFDETVQAEINQLRSDGDDAAADELCQESAKQIEDRAQEALERAQNGENFDDLIVEYGDDPGMMTQSQRAEGYLVCRDSMDYAEAFRQASLELTREGQISDLVLTDYGYHIIYAMEVYPEHTVALDEIYDQIQQDLLDTQKGVAYVDAIEQVYADTKVEYYYKRLLRGSLNTLDYDNAWLVEPNRFAEGT